MKKLDDLPQSIQRGISPEMSLVTYEGLSTQLGKNQTPNDLLLPIHKPNDDDSGMNFGVMFYNHDQFHDRYEVYPHKINFKKDRETLVVGKTTYTANLSRYLKETKITYSLRLTKGISSPLFVPFVDDVFLVLDPINDTNQSDNPPLIVDDDDDEDNFKSELLAYNKQKVKNYIEIPDKYFEPPMEEVSDFEEDEGLKQLFEPSKRVVVQTVPTREEAEAFNEVAGQTQQTSLVSFDKKNDPVYQAQEDFLKMYPQAGGNMDTFDYLSHGMIPPTEEEVDLTDPKQLKLDQDFNGYIVEDIDENDTIPLDDVYVTFEENNGEHLCIIASDLPPKSEYRSLKTKIDNKDREVLVNDIEIELTPEDEAELNVNIFDTPKGMKMKPTDSRKYCEDHKDWNCGHFIGWSLCKYPIPDPIPDEHMHFKKSFKTQKAWRKEARWSCNCGGDIQYHLDKELEQGVELTSKHSLAFDKPLFDLVEEIDEEGVEINDTEYGDIFETPKESLSDILEEHSNDYFRGKSIFVDGDKYTFGNLRPEYKEGYERLGQKSLVDQVADDEIKSLRNSKRSSFTRFKSKSNKRDRTKLDNRRQSEYHGLMVGEQLYLPYNKVKPTVNRSIDANVPLYIRKVV